MLDRRNRSQLIHHAFDHSRRRIHIHHADRAAGITPQGEIRDIDALPAENRADFADDARLIVVLSTGSLPGSCASTGTPFNSTRRGPSRARPCLDLAFAGARVTSFSDSRLRKLRAA